MQVLAPVCLIGGLLLALRLAHEHHQQSPKGRYEGTRITEVGDTSTGVLACPNCKSTHFKAKRSGGAKIIAATGFGLLAVPLMPKTRVRCETCAVEFIRG